MRQSKISPVVLFTTIAALATSATASPVGTTYDLKMTNLPVDITLLGVEFDPNETDFNAGGGGVVSEIAGVNNNQEFVEFWIEWFDEMVPDSDVDGGISIEGLHWGGSSGRVVQDSAYLYFTMDRVAQTMVDTGSLNVDLGSHPLDSNIQVLLLNNPSTSTDAFGFSASDFGAAGMLSLLSGLGIDSPDLINDLHFGFAIDHSQMPEPSSATLFGIGALALLRVARSRRRRNSRQLP